MRGYLGELRGIWNQKKMVIALLGIVFMPLLYGGVLVWSFWDPYGQLDQLPVAVVNEDRGAIIEGEQLNAGHDFVDELKKDPVLDFHFVSKNEAERGLSEHDYYFYVEIPKTFSEDISTLKESSPTNARVFYEVNEDYNYVSSQIAANVVEEMEKELSSTLTLAYIEIANDAFSDLTDAVIALEEGSSEIAVGNENASESMNRLKDGLMSIKEGAADLQSGMSEATEGSDELEAGFEKARREILAFTDSTNVDEMFRDTNQLVTEAITHLESSDTEELAKVIDKLDGHLREVNVQLNQADEQVQVLSEKVVTIQNQVNLFQQELDLVFTTLDKYSQELTIGLDHSLDELKQWNETIQSTSEKLNGSLGAFEDLQLQIEQLPAILDGIYPDWREHEELVNWFEGANQRAIKFGEVQREFKESFKMIQTKTPELIETLEERQQKINNELVAVNSKIAESQSTLDQFFQETNEQSEELLRVLNQLSDALQTVENALPNSLNGEEVTKNFTNQYDDVLNTLYQVDEKMNSAQSLFQKSQEASRDAFSGVQQLNAGLHELLNGTDRLHHSLKDASAGSEDLVDGLITLRDGSDDLAFKMNELKDVLLKVNPNEEQENMVVSPVQSKSHSPLEDQSYGVGLSPYFLSIGLYVGGLTLSIIYPFRAPLAQHQTAWQWYSGKLGVVLTVGFLQSSLVTLFMLYVLKLDVASKVAFTSFTIFTSMVFLSLIFFLVSVLDNPGRFIAIILLILQLGGSAGSFPIEMLASPLQTLHGWLPMTYSVLGFRSVIFMGVTTFLWNSVVFMLILMVLTLVGAFVYFHFAFKRQGIKKKNLKEAVS
ncbi:YhgE/Pip domain-containing protein [Alkalihalophilus lindianensis]|uniref:YhgE/Pip domain-containing protein n=1 Tax=Alkalihalophilus lindianensis TaxID=1630542 RepID=A0ABU3X5X8_9BACI|nr:YhgE/Pip domain-containing protein [Alkalihalophilus lindianensis]MDV2683290.1 YhgE/Pip domain-containing protein [Alkalihalophilus lindianensis]